INVFGLAVSMACCISIAIYTKHELSYDRFNEKADRIYRVCLDRVYPERRVLWASIAPGTYDGVRELPEVESVTRISHDRRTVAVEDKKGFEEKVIRVDPSFLSIFTVHFVSGNPRTALRDPSSIILTESAAQKYI